MWSYMICTTVLGTSYSTAPCVVLARLSPLQAWALLLCTCILCRAASNVVITHAGPREEGSICTTTYSSKKTATCSKQPGFSMPHVALQNFHACWKASWDSRVQLPNPRQDHMCDLVLICPALTSNSSVHMWVHSEGWTLGTLKLSSHVSH